MSEVILRWTQRVAGRRPGDVETVERTPFIEAAISFGRAQVIGEIFGDDVPEVPKARALRAPKPSLLDTGTTITTANPDSYITTNEAPDGNPEAV